MTGAKCLISSMSFQALIPSFQDYCDHCQREFPLANRRQHLSGNQHKQKVKEHYDQFKSIVEDIEKKAKS